MLDLETANPVDATRLVGEALVIIVVEMLASVDVIAPVLQYTDVLVVEFKPIDVDAKIFTDCVLEAENLTTEDADFVIVTGALVPVAKFPVDRDPIGANSDVELMKSADVGFE